MSVDIKVPPLPESVTEATVAAWHKKPGDAVARDENLVDLETDKVVLEVPCPQDGVLGEVLKEEGETVTANEILGRVEEGAAAPREESAPAAEQPAGAAPGGEPAAAAATATAAPPAQAFEGLSPAVRRLVGEYGVDPRRIDGSGPGGRVTKADILKHVEGGAPAPEAAPAPASEAPSTAQAPAAPSAPPGARLEERVPMTRLRQRVAERLVEAQQTAAMLTTFNECNMKPVMEMRARYRERFEKAHGVRLGFMSFFVKAAVEALKRFPAVNASIDGNDIIYHGYYDIGIAVSSSRGLVVPVVRDADKLSFAEIEKTINDYGQRAQEGKLAMDDLTGGTFTITNGGIFGSLVSTPILNPPQSGILGMHKIQERPVAENGEVVVRPMMYLAHTYDHRIIDGREAVQFLVAIKDCIEDPARLLLEI